LGGKLILMEKNLKKQNKKILVALGGTKLKAAH
jgi:hypothetical protein